MVSPHKYIRNTSTDRTILKDHLLSTSGRLQIPERVRNIPMQPLGWRKDEKRNQKKKPAILVKSWRGGGSPTIRKKEEKTLQWGCLLAREGIFRDQKGTGWKAYAKQDEIRNVHVVCVAVLCCPSPSLVSPAVEGGWMLEGGGLEHGPSEGTAIGCRKTAWRERGKELRNQEGLWKRPRTPQKGDIIAEWHAKGGDSQCNPFPHQPASASSGPGKGTHQACPPLKLRPHLPA